MARVNEVNIILIKQLNQLAERNPDLLIPVYNPVTDKTVSIKASTLTGGEAVNARWQADTPYLIDEIVEWNDKLWKSKTGTVGDPNLNNPPAENQYWTEVSKSEGDGTIGYWAAGIYTTSPTLVIQSDSLYLLDPSVPIPFESANFNTELIDGKWINLTANTFTSLIDTINDYTGLDGEKLIIDETAGKIISAPSTTSSGFYNRSDFIINFDGVDLTLTGTFDYVNAIGRKVTVTDPSITVAPVNGVMYFYLDNDGNLLQLNSPNRITQYQQMLITVPVVYMLYNSNAALYSFVGDYAKLRSPSKLWVKNFFDNEVQTLQGLVVNGLTGGDGSSNADIQLGLSAGELIFVDREYTVPTRNTIDPWNVGYFDANLDPTGVTANPYLVLTDVDLGVGTTGRVVYNNDGSPIAADSGDFVWYFIVQTVDFEPSDRTLSFMGNGSYGNEGNADAALQTEIALIESLLPVRQGAKLKYAELIETKSTFTNAVKGRIVKSVEVVREGGATPTVTVPSDLVNGSDASYLHNHNSLYQSLQIGADGYIYTSIDGVWVKTALASDVTLNFTSADTAATINTALDAVPSILNGYQLNLVITNGDTVTLATDEVLLTRFRGGSIHIKSSSDTVSAGIVKDSVLNGAIVTSCFTELKITNIDFSRSATASGAYVRKNDFGFEPIRFYKCTFNADGNLSGGIYNMQGIGVLDVEYKDCDVKGRDGISNNKNCLLFNPFTDYNSGLSRLRVIDCTYTSFKIPYLYVGNANDSILIEIINSEIAINDTLDANNPQVIRYPITGGVSTWDDLTDTFDKSTNAKKLAKVSDDELTIEPTNYDYDQVVNTADIDVSDPTWVESESRLLEVKKVSGEATFEGATQLIDIFAPPGIDTSLENQSSWSNESKTLTGENYRGELGKVGQLRVLDDGTICRCISSTQGTDGGADGSATYRRNRAVDTLHPDTNTQDSDVCDLLDPSRTGGTTDDGWDLVTNIKVISTVPAREGTWWKVSGGYSYFCYAVSGTSYYWFRSGQPAAIYRYINTTNYPNLTTNLLAHDFGASVYTEQAGDETTYQDQVFYNLATREYFVKVNATQWEQLK